MKESLFTEMMAGFAEAAKHRRGQRARVRVSRFSPDVAASRPKEIRKIRTALGLSQADFAHYLGRSRSRRFVDNDNSVHRGSHTIADAAGRGKGR